MRYRQCTRLHTHTHACADRLVTVLVPAFFFISKFDFRESLQTSTSCYNHDTPVQPETQPFTTADPPPPPTTLSLLWILLPHPCSIHSTTHTHTHTHTHALPHSHSCDANAERTFEEKHYLFLVVASSLRIHRPDSPPPSPHTYPPLSLFLPPWRRPYLRSSHIWGGVFICLFLTEYFKTPHNTNALFAALFPLLRKGEYTHYCVNAAGGGCNLYFVWGGGGGNDDKKNNNNNNNNNNNRQRQH